MTRKLAPYSSNPRHLLSRILEEPGLVSVIQSLDAPVLGKLVEHIGLEDSGEIISLATTEQLEKVFDLDLWRSEKPGREETFDADRFATWLEILLEVGAHFAAAKIAEMDEDFLTLALSRQILVIDIDELAMRMSSGHGRSRFDDDILEKALESGLNQEFEEFRVISKNHRSWDAVLTLLVELDREHHDLLRTILERCHAISTEYIEDNGGLYQVLTADEQIQSDVAYERVKRREKEGYVTPETAASFLGLIRISKLDELTAAQGYDPVTQAYFRDFEPAKQSQPRVAASGTAEMLQLLKDAGVISASQSTLLLRDARENLRSPLFRSALLAARTADSKQYAKAMSELNYLANVLVSGCGFAGRSFRPAEAAEATLATCNLGLEHLLSKNPKLSAEQALHAQDAVQLFRIGWSILFQDVIQAAAKQLMGILPGLAASGDSWIQKQMEALVIFLKTLIAQGKPWEIQERLDLLGTVLEPAEVQGLKQVLDECPSVPSAADVEFISSRAQVETVHLFLEKLSRLKAR